MPLCMIPISFSQAPNNMIDPSRRNRYPYACNENSIVSIYSSMTAFGELPAETQTTLSTEEIAQFRDTVIAPSIQWLKHGYNFFTEAPIGSRFDIEETVVIDCTKVVVGVAVEIFPLYPGETSDCQRSPELQVTTEFADPELGDSLVDAARADGVVIDPEDDDQGLLSAWLATVYAFDGSDDDPFELKKYHMLKHADGTVLWSDEKTGEDLDSLPESELENLELLHELMRADMNTEHVEYVRFALSTLGVPDEIVYV